MSQHSSSVQMCQALTQSEHSESQAMSEIIILFRRTDCSCLPDRLCSMLSQASQCDTRPSQGDLRQGTLFIIVLFEAHEVVVGA